MPAHERLEGEVHADAKREIRDLVAMSPVKAVFVGDTLRQLHGWCESGVPEGFEGTVPRPGVTMYAIANSAIDAIMRVVVQGNKLRLLAAGLYSDDKTVLSAALSRI